MSIQGDLQSSDLSSVFQMLALNQTTGLLRVHDRRDSLRSRSLVLDGASIGVHAMPNSDTGGLQWVEQELIPLEVWNDLHRRSESVGMQIGELARSEGTLSPELAQAASRQAQFESILEVFLWPNVVFSLDESVVPADQEGRVFFQVDRIVMESARRQDEWDRIRALIADGHHIFHLNPKDPAGSSASEIVPVSSALLGFVDGVRGLQETVNETGLSRYSCGIHQAALLSSGHIVPMALDDLLISGDRMLRENIPVEALRLFRSALRFNRRSVSIHKRIAVAHESVEQFARAGAHLRFCSFLLARKGQAADAYKAALRAHSLVPTDFKALRMAMGFLAQLDMPLTEEDESLLSAGRQLFHFYAESGSLRMADRVACLIRSIAPDDLALAVEHARVLARSKRTAEASESYRQIAEEFIRQGNVTGAVSLLRIAMELNPACRGACTRKIRSLETNAEDRAARKKRGLFAFSLTAICLLVAVGYFYYHNQAGAHLETVKSSDANATNEASWMGQAERYRDVAQRFPFTSAGLQAEGLEESARSRARDHRHQEWEKQQAQENASANRLDVARHSFVTGLSCQTGLDLDGALACFISAQKVAEELGASEWLEQHEISQRIHDITAHLSAERIMAARLKTALVERRFEGAHSIAQEMLGPRGLDALDPANIHVISGSCRERIEVPYRIVVVPDDASLTLEDSLKKRLIGDVLLLNASCDQVSVHALSKSGGSASLELNWRDEHHNQLLPIPNTPTSRRKFGQRVRNLIPWRSGVCAVCADGSLRVIDGPKSEIWTLLPKEGIDPIAGDVFRVDDLVIFADTDGDLHCASLRLKKWLWIRESSSNDALILAADKKRVLLTAGNRLLGLNTETGHVIWDVEAKSAPRLGGMTGEFAWTLNEAGAVAQISLATGRTVLRMQGPFIDAVGLSSGALLAFTHESVVCFFTDSARKPEARKLASSLQALATVGRGRAYWLEETGDVVSWDGIGQVRSVGTRLRGVISQGSRLSYLEGGTILAAATGENVLRIDPRTGGVLSVLSGASQTKDCCVAQPSGLYFRHDKNDGDVEIFDDD